MGAHGFNTSSRIRPTANELHLLMQGNALGAFSAELEARGKGTAAGLQKELGANLLPGVTLVPAMVIAIEQAQSAGIAYKRQ